MRSIYEIFGGKGGTLDTPAEPHLSTDPLDFTLITETSEWKGKVVDVSSVNPVNVGETESMYVLLKIDARSWNTKSSKLNVAQQEIKKLQGQIEFLKTTMKLMLSKEES